MTLPNGLAWEEENIVPTVGPDFDLIDSRLSRQENAAPATDERVEIVNRILDVVLDCRTDPRAVGVRCLVLAKLAGHHSMSRTTLADLARIAGVTKQCFSKVASELREQLGIHSSWMRSDVERANMAVAARESWRKKKAVTQPGATAKLNTDSQ